MFVATCRRVDVRPIERRIAPPAPAPAGDARGRRASEGRSSRQMHAASFIIMQCACVALADALCAGH